MTTETGQPAGAVAESYAHVERKVFSIFQIVSPLILLVTTFIHPHHGIQATSGPSYYGAAYDHTTAFYIAHTGFFLTIPTLIVAFLGMNRLVRATHPKAAFWGLVLSAMGFAGWGTMAGMDFMTFNAGRFSTGSSWSGSLGGSLDPNTMETYISDALGDQFVQIPVFGIFTLLIIGLVVNAVGLHRAGLVHFFHALLLPIGVGGSIFLINFKPLDIAAAVCVCLAVIPFGWKGLRTPDATAPQAAST